MATLNALKGALCDRAKVLTSSTRALTEAEYAAGFDIVAREETAYGEFVIPQLSSLLASLLELRSGISVLEIGPGPRSVLGDVPANLRSKVLRYAAYEPNRSFATSLEKWLCSDRGVQAPFTSLEGSPSVHRRPFTVDTIAQTDVGHQADSTDGHFDVILFCHSMYGMKPKERYIEEALSMLRKEPESGLVVVFHRDGPCHVEGLACSRTASFPTGVTLVADDDQELDSFATFIAGASLQDVESREIVRIEWRKVCRALARRDSAHPRQLLFSSPNIMLAFGRGAASLAELSANIPLVDAGTRVKNQEASSHHPALTLRPTEVAHIQQCVRWALSHGVGLTVVGGGHSGHCRAPCVVALDMSAFDRVNVLRADEHPDVGGASLVIAETGCKSGDLVRTAMIEGLTLPLGSRPSVGAGLWLQGGIGHLARSQGLACDAIVGAVLVDVAAAQILCVGNVPSRHRPAGAIRPKNEVDLLWALRGAGNNIGIVLSVTFSACAAPSFTVRDWIVPVKSDQKAREELLEIDRSIATKLPNEHSIDVYMYGDTNGINLGITTIETEYPHQQAVPTSKASRLGPAANTRTVDAVGLYDTEMYLSGQIGGEHSRGKTSSFKRCVFLRRVGSSKVAEVLITAIQARPSPLCYFHLLQGGGAVGEIATDATAFGCRKWDFACVVTGVWARDEDGTEAARAATQWVYDVAMSLLPVSEGVYGADLGPDPRDTALAKKAFGTNRSRLACIKRVQDPRNVLAHACPLPTAPKLIILVTGGICAGKDFCAEIWGSTFEKCSGNNTKAHVVRISDATKREYATAKGANFERLIHDRKYKEEHRPNLTAYYQEQSRQRPRLPEEHFLDVVFGDGDGMDVLLITGMRDPAPVATFAHLVPGSRLIEVEVEASDITRQARGGGQVHSDLTSTESDNKNRECKGSDSLPTLTFLNATEGSEEAQRFAKECLLPFMDDDHKRLAGMVRRITGFPSPGVEFRDVLGIAKQPGGLGLCTSLMQRRFTGNRSSIDTVVCCEAGGFIFASALAARIDVPLAIARGKGKIPSPTIAVTALPSHISSLATGNLAYERTVEMGEGAVRAGHSVVVIDDVLASGSTLCAVLQLLQKAGVDLGDVKVMVVAEFPLHRGRELLRLRGYGGVKVDSVLRFGGV